MAEPLLEAQALGKRFGEVTALRDVDLTLAHGEIHALCGENGAGKSTLIKLLSGVYPAGSFQGRIRIEGKPVRFRSRRDACLAGIGVIPQELALVEGLSVADNIFLGCEPVRAGFWLDRDRALREAQALLARFGVAIDPAAPLQSLGMGQRQLVEILKALARDSRLLILDEPTAALAPHEVERLLAILRELRTQGISCLYISHRLDEVFRIADRITVLRDGRSVGTWPSAEVSEDVLIRHMVGRDLGALFPHTPVARGERLLSVRGLCAADPRSPLRLEDISLDLHAGEVLGIGGLMGAGRSELLMHLYGMWGRRRAGEIHCLGRVLAEGGPRERLAAGLALVSEDRRRFGLHLDEALPFNLSLARLAERSCFAWIDREAERTQAQHWTTALAIRARDPDGPVGRFSGGNQQKAALARMLVTGPRVLMLDEPTRGIDIAAKAELYALVDRLRQQGCGVLLVSSELPELIGLSDRILMLRAGRVGGHFGQDGQRPSAEALLQAAL